LSAVTQIMLLID